MHIKFVNTSTVIKNQISTHHLIRLIIILDTYTSYTDQKASQKLFIQLFVSTYFFHYLTLLSYTYQLMLTA